MAPSRERPRQEPAVPFRRPSRAGIIQLQRGAGNAAVSDFLVQRQSVRTPPAPGQAQDVDQAIASGDADAVKALDPHGPLDDARRVRLIEIVLDQFWVGPSDESWLERCWGALDADALLRFAGPHLDLWDRCRDRGAELDELPAVGVIRRRFTDEVLALAHHHLRTNQMLVERELEAVGLARDGSGGEREPTLEQSARLAAIQAASTSLAHLQRAHEAARQARVGWRIGDGGDVDPDWTGRQVKYQVLFDPAGPAPQFTEDPDPEMPPGDIFIYPVVPHAEVKERYDAASERIAALVAAVPALYGLALGGRSDVTGAFADTEDPRGARAALGGTLTRVLADIRRTGAALGDDLHPLDLTPLHEQLHTGTAPVGTIHWTGGFGWRVASDAARDHAVDRALGRVLLQAVTHFAFLFAPFTSGASLLLLLGTGTAAAAINAYGSYQQAQTLAAAEGTAVAPGTDLVRPGTAGFAQMQAEADMVAFGLALLALGGAAFSAWRAGAEVRALRAQTRALVRQARAAGQEVVVNIGGAGEAHEPAGAINVNPQVPGTERRGIPNLVQAPGEQIGDLFTPRSVDRIEGHHLPGGAIDWDRVADGAAKVLRPNGTLEIYFRGAHPGAQQLRAALLRHGFRDVTVVQDVLITATR